MRLHMILVRNQIQIIDVQFSDHFSLISITNLVGIIFLPFLLSRPGRLQRVHGCVSKSKCMIYKTRGLESD